MSAIPKIAVRPLVRPAFVVTETFVIFCEINSVALRDWYEACRAAGQDESDDFDDFCAVQFDLVCDEEAEKEPRHRGAPGVRDTRSFEEQMEDWTGKPAVGPL